MSENISVIEEKFGRCIIAPSGAEIQIEYNRDGDYHCLCECGNRALYARETSTYKCKCGWESACVTDHPDKFIDLEDIQVVD